METKNSKKTSWLELIITIGGILLFAHLVSKLISYLLENEIDNEDYNIKDKRKRKPRIFISHSWSHDKDYLKLIKGFEKQGFEYYNHSIPLEKSVDLKTNREIENKIKNQLLYSRCLLVLGGKYSNKYWIRKEVEIAKSLGKKIIAIKPWNSEDIPKYLESKADEIIRFNTRTVIERIK